jgi:hypothetical protein
VSKGIYNATYFKNYPEEAVLEGVLYIVVLVNKQTSLKECVKIGITKGRNWKAAIKRSKGFNGYEIRIQKIVSGTLEQVFFLEDYLHELWQEHRYFDSHHFSGHTELFKLDKLKDILDSVPHSF